MEWHRSWVCILILIYPLDAYDFRKRNVHAREIKNVSHNFGIPYSFRVRIRIKIRVRD